MTIKVENKADMVQQLRETFHDMRQPVATMMALAAAALTEPDLPAAAQHRLEQIIEQAEWLSDMIRNCLPTQQREEPDETGKPRRDLADMVQVVGEVIEAECLTWPGDMKLAAPDGPVWCMVDPVLLRRAVSNVLDNAARAAGPDRNGERGDPAVRRRPSCSRWRTTVRASARSRAARAWD